eukprot:CAMPEP_0184296492 /NCGR_PEP_ID=MMETSP1049-20130417/7462_1 /TAXON_ID=77928 /ORGANISM="Proteomonas sulcata, Strain CCMP704" /LENGTH=39 /DNA_ID= /DNA_START= /DNA_END= /DNA_ORIENTATION=
MAQTLKTKDLGVRELKTLKPSAQGVRGLRVFSNHLLLSP